VDQARGEQQARHDPQRTGFSANTVRLAWTLALAYLLVIGYASLLPFRDWRWPPEEILHFLAAPWPRFITPQDLAVNFAAYIPLGLLLSVGFGARYGPARGAVAATLAAALLSVTMEAVQMFLPARIASNVDLLANTLGAVAGLANQREAPVRRQTAVEAPATPFGGAAEETAAPAPPPDTTTPGRVP